MDTERLPVTPGPLDLHLWCLPIARALTAAERQRLLAQLSKEERQRHDRLLVEGGRDQFLAAHVLLRVVVSRATGMAPFDVAFTTTPHGRPELARAASGPRLRFNLSHTEGLVVCGLAQERDIGVDAESGRRLRDGLDIARRFYAPAELAVLESLPEDRRRAAFLDFWTLKEAYLKAIGLGLAHSLAGFALQLEPEIRIAFADPADDPRGWQFALFHPTATHHLAVAAHRHPAERLQPRLIWTSVDALMGAAGPGA